MIPFLKIKLSLSVCVYDILQAYMFIAETHRTLYNLLSFFQLIRNIIMAGHILIGNIHVRQDEKLVIRISLLHFVP